MAAVLRETAIYLRRHLVLEPWGTPPAGSPLGPLLTPPETSAGDDETVMAERRTPDVVPDPELLHEPEVPVSGGRVSAD